MLSLESIPLTSAGGLASANQTRNNYDNGNDNNYYGATNHRSEVLSSVGSIDDDIDGSSSSEDRTTAFQTFVHLLKGYMGAGCLSLPWAVSQLGMVWGPLAIVAVSFWSSYNCWTVVKLKRYIEVKTTYIDDKASEAESASVATTNTNLTYPDVGDWAYGASFHTYVKVSLCTQQLAICTVFISFVGENILAVLNYYGYDEERGGFLATHAGVMTIILPPIIALSLIPTLKLLSPVMAAGTAFLTICFVAIGVIVVQEWDERPDEVPPVNPPQVPLAVCAILYSYEGINLILPVESAMKEPKQFKTAFMAAMICVAVILASIAIVCVLAFGYVDSGSVTAFLFEAYRDDPTIIGWLMLANTAVSISVLVTYPLQLFPAVELLAPSLSKFLSCGKDDGTGNLDDEDDDDLSGFEPLPPLPEHGAADWGDEELEFHQYDDEGNRKRTGTEEYNNTNSNSNSNSEADYDNSNNNNNNNNSNNDDADDTASVARSALTSVVSMLPKMTMPGDSITVRLFLVIMTYLVAVVVPNVQSLISLAGAVAGSSSALLIPPFLELAWIQHLEYDATAIGDDKREDGCWQRLMGWAKYLSLDRLKCYILLAFGFLFFGIGTYASLADIVKIYKAGE